MTGTCSVLTGLLDREEAGLLVVTVSHSCLRPACAARRWRVVRLPLTRRPEVGDRIVTFGPNEVVR